MTDPTTPPVKPEAKTSQIQINISVSTGWATDTATDLCELLGLPIPGEGALVWNTKQGLTIAIVKRPDHCIMVYSMPVNDMAEFLEALLEASRWVPESFMNLDQPSPEKAPLELAPGPLSNIFEHPHFSFAGNAEDWLLLSKELEGAPLGKGQEEWTEWFASQASDFPGLDDEDDS